MGAIVWVEWVGGNKVWSEGVWLVIEETERAGERERERKREKERERGKEEGSIIACRTGCLLSYQ